MERNGAKGHGHISLRLYLEYPKTFLFSKKKGWSSDIVTPEVRHSNSKEYREGFVLGNRYKIQHSG